MVMFVKAGKSTEETPVIYKCWTELTEELEIEQLCQVEFVEFMNDKINVADKLDPIVTSDGKAINNLNYYQFLFLNLI